MFGQQGRDHRPVGGAVDNSILEAEADNNTPLVGADIRTSVEPVGRSEALEEEDSTFLAVAQLQPPQQAADRSISEEEVDNNTPASVEDISF